MFVIGVLYHTNASQVKLFSFTIIKYQISFTILFDTLLLISSKADLVTLVMFILPAVGFTLFIPRSLSEPVHVGDIIIEKEISWGIKTNQ